MMISSVRRTVAILIAVVWGTLASTQALAQFPVYWVPVSGDYNNGNNWSDEPDPLIGRGSIPDGPSLGEFASISHNGTAIVSSAIATSPGGVVLGELAGGTGTLSITGGSLTSVAVAPTNTGNIEVGRAGRGYLNVSGGTLTAPGLTVAGEDLATGSGRSAANFSGSATVTINGATSFTRNLMIAGPGVNFTSTGAVSLSATNIYTPVITGASHSPIKSDTNVIAGGNLNVQFSGAPPTLGSTWTLFDGLAVGGVFANEGTGRTVVPTAGVTPTTGAAFRLRNQAGGLGQQLQLLYESVLVLDVNRDTGNLTIANPLDGSYAIDGYSVSSSNGSLLASWAGLGQAGWEKAGATVNGLSELKMTAGAGLPVTSAQSRNLGTGFNELAGAATGITGLGGTAEDLVFNYTLPGETLVRSGQIRYIGSQYTDNLTVFVDPSGDAQLKNDSQLSLSLDGYQLQSSTGAFTPGSWSGIDGPGGSWLQGPDTGGTANALVETRPSGPVVLTPGATFNLGDIGNFATAEARAGVSMQFILDPVFHAGGVTGDYNEDGTVNAADYTVWRNMLGTAGALPNRDPGNGGNISQDDYDSWKTNFGDSGSGGNITPADLFRNGTIVFLDTEFGAGGGGLAAAAVPEPTTGGLLLLGLGGLLGVWQRRRSSHESNYAACSQGAQGAVRRYVAMLKPTLRLVSVVGGILVALGLAMPAQSQVLTSSIVNPNFDDSITAKTEWWDATGAIVMPNPIVGWETTGPGNPLNMGGPVAGPGDSGIEQAGVGGSWALYLSSPDPAAIQTTSHNIVSGRNYILSFQLAHVFTSTGIAAAQASFYYQDGENRVPLGSQQYTQTAGAYTPQALLLTAAQMAAGVGQPLGIEFENVSGATAIGGKDNNSWYHFDNLQLVAAGGIGDVNTNGTTDMADFEIIRQNMLSGLTGWADGDLTGDGIIDIRDFRQWTLDPAIAGSGMASAALNALGVPEPSSVILVLLSSAFFVNCRRRRTAGSANETEDRSQAMMSRKSLKVQRLIGMLSVLLVCGSANRGLSATLGNSPSAPAGPYLASQLTDDTGGLLGNNDFTDNGGPPGQTFQVSSAGMASRFTIKGGGNSAGGWTTGPIPFDGTEIWGIQISTVDSGTGALTVISSETATGFLGGSVINVTDYLTFTLDTPVALSPDTTYAMSVAQWDSVAGPGTQKGWFGLAHSAADVYADGLAFNNNLSTANPGDNSGAPRFQFTEPGFVAPMVTPYDYVFAIQTAAVVTIPGDTNGDGQVNLADFNNIRDNFRAVVPTGTLGDINGPIGSPNGFVDLWDFAEWKENRTDLGTGSGSIVGVPEPASYVLLMTAATLVAGRRRRAANRIGS